MKANNIKRILIVLICSLGLYSSGNYLIGMSYIDTLFDGLNVMVFFTSFFPFLIVTVALTRDFLRSLSRLVHY
ncbi:hypothetical protein [Polaribacter sp. Hel_I_88]|uniref:hypothetical protein n=1 Tax=Polaribacter sp. Hel_I_88 TaxID=1250006 RepID=UPI0012DDB276|nr:hypothetical protein [Polaribacter sp. Hel_I_88]